MFNAKKLLTGFGAATALLFTAATSFAAPLVLKPADLNPGDQYRLVFLTDSTTNFLNQTDAHAQYDSFINSEVASSPELSALNTTWQAVYSGRLSAGGNLNARQHTGTDHIGSNTDQGSNDNGVSIYLVDGNRVADGNIEFWRQHHQAAIDVTQSGASDIVSLVWTGTRIYGDWQSPTHGNAYAYGHSWETNVKNFIGRNVRNVQSGSSIPLYRMYGISGVLTVESVPAPGAFALLGLGLLGLVARRRTA